eukprot:jgi/Hompol1/244/HPOL_000393-RA
MLADALAQIDLATSSLVVVSTARTPVVCRVVVHAVEQAHAQAHAQAKAQAKAQEVKKPQRAFKEFEVNSSISAHDLGTKARRAADALAKGLDVHLAVVQRQPHPADPVLARFITLLSPVGTPTGPGNNLLYAALDFPIFGIYPSNRRYSQNIAAINEALDFNIKKGYAGNPVYAMQFDALMFAAVDSATCLRRNRCIPIGGSSVWSTFSTNITPADNKPIVFVTSKFDSVSFIHDFSFGAARKSGLVAMLAAVEALSRLPANASMSSLSKNVVFSAFEAETWGFAGSKRFVDDLASFNCVSPGPSQYCNGKCASPCRLTTDFTAIKFDKIESVIEFDTIGDITRPGSATANYFLHVDSVGIQTTSLVNAFKTTATIAPFNGSSSISLSINPAFTSTTNNRLPPSSAMAFLAKRSSISALVISDYQTQFSNRYFNSEFDDGSQWNANNVATICGVVNSTAKSIYTVAGGSAANAATINANCTLANYVEIAGKCFLSLTRRHEAYGTGISYDGATGIYTVTDPSLPAWTESK